jgi:hypothetical protein
VVELLVETGSWTSVQNLLLNNTSLLRAADELCTAEAEMVYFNDLPGTSCWLTVRALPCAGTVEHGGDEPRSQTAWVFNETLSFST